MAHATDPRPAVTLPRIKPYRNYSSSNYGAHCLRVDFPGATVWFSYQTPIAFQVSGRLPVVRRNDWGPTTGKHLNAIDGGGGAKASRVSGEEFARLWAEQINTPCP